MGGYFSAGGDFSAVRILAGQAPPHTSTAREEGERLAPNAFTVDLEIGDEELDLEDEAANLHSAPTQVSADLSDPRHSAHEDVAMTDRHEEKHQELSVVSLESLATTRPSEPKVKPPLESKLPIDSKPPLEPKPPLVMIQSEVKDIRHPDEEKKEAIQLFSDAIKGMNETLVTHVVSIYGTAKSELRKGNELPVPFGACVIVIDLETTGLFKGDTAPLITELAAVSLSNPSEFISTLVCLDGSVPIDKGASATNSITAFMCNRDGKTEMDALLTLATFITEQMNKNMAEKVYLVAHNAFAFDSRIISSAFARQDMEAVIDRSKVFWIDSLVAARATGRRRNSLGALVEEQFPLFDPKCLHRALPDCLALAALLYKNDSGIFNSLFSDVRSF